MANFESVNRIDPFDFYSCFLARSVEEIDTFRLKKVPTKNLVRAPRNLNFREVNLDFRL